MRAALGLRPETVQWFLGRYSTDDALSDLVTERDTHEQTALHKAALAKLERQSPFYEERRARKRDTIDALIDAEANPLTEDRKGKTPADIARENDDLESAEYLERLSTELTSGTEPMIDADPHQQMGLRMSACDQQAASQTLIQVMRELPRVLHQSRAITRTSRTQYSVNCAEERPLGSEADCHVVAEPAWLRQYGSSLDQNVHRRKLFTVLSEFIVGIRRSWSCVLKTKEGG